MEFKYESEEFILSFLKTAATTVLTRCPFLHHVKSSIECHVARLLLSPQENCQQKSTDNLQNTMSKKNEPKNKDG